METGTQWVSTEESLEEGAARRERTPKVELSNHEAVAGSARGVLGKGCGAQGRDQLHRTHSPENDGR